MQEFAEELAWWSDVSSVDVQTDLSAYAEDVERLRAANVVAKVESKEQELNRLWDESLGRIYTPISIAVNNPLLQAGLQQVGGPRQIQGWSSEEYGGAAQTPTWGIGTIASPWLAAAFGAVHRS